MFTTLNLTLSSQLPTESGVLRAQTTEGQPIFDAATFAASLDLWHGGEPSGDPAGDLAGSPLPLAGIELPLDGETGLAVLPDDLPDNVAPDAGLLSGDPGLVVDWPPGLSPAESAESPVDASSLADTGGDGSEAFAATALPDTPEEIVPAVAAIAAAAATESEAPVPAVPAGMLRDAELSGRRPSLADNARGLGVESTESRADGSLRPVLPNGDGGETLAVTRSASVPQPEVVPGQRAPEWNLPGAASSSAPDSGALNALANGNANARAPAGQVQAQALPTINTPVGEPGFGDSIADRVLLMASNRLGNAEIRLTPAELGPVRVQVSLDDGAANVQFHAAQAATRDALEQAMPRLREMLAENGLSLGQASVSDEGSRQGVRDNAGNTGDTGTGHGSEATADAEIDIDPETGTTGHEARISNALVDTFA